MTDASAIADDILAWVQESPAHPTILRKQALEIATLALARTNPCPISSAVARDLAERAARGVVKYGVTLGEARLGRRELIRHAYEESLDMACYLRALLEEKTE